MSSVTKIIDAVSEPVVSAATANNVQSVPLKIDASQMQQVLKGLVSKQMQLGPQGPVNGSAANAGIQTDAAVEKINPSIYIKTISDEIERLYTRFDKLKKLAVELHGLQLDAPIPDRVRLKNIVINFSLVKDGNTEDHVVEIANVSSVGDLTTLMATEFGVIILSLTEQSKNLADLAQKTGDRCSSALQEWENNNKDKKIVRPSDVASVSAEPIAGGQGSDAPVTLEAS